MRLEFGYWTSKPKSQTLVLLSFHKQPQPNPLSPATKPRLILFTFSFLLPPQPGNHPSTAAKATDHPCSPCLAASEQCRACSKEPPTVFLSGLAGFGLMVVYLNESFVGLLGLCFCAGLLYCG
ncbi:hypothetical protein AKJ16_DCAP06406 [Drosera capensis]